tara:strand:- start:696 stop:818 length:123 start_codon:yes stop_codon:yes gene_type:complete
MSNKKKIEELKKVVDKLGKSYELKGEYLYFKLWKVIEGLK